MISTTRTCDDASYIITQQTIADALQRSQRLHGGLHHGSRSAEYTEHREGRASLGVKAARADNYLENFLNGICCLTDWKVAHQSSCPVDALQLSGTATCSVRLHDRRGPALNVLMVSTKCSTAAYT